MLQIQYGNILLPIETLPPQPEQRDQSWYARPKRLDGHPAVVPCFAEHLENVLRAGVTTSGNPAVIF
jgi:hypothetical protein